MENSKDFIKNLILGQNYPNDLFIRNIIREYLQALVLDFIYSDSKHNRLVFYGGSCLAHCFGLPRLSEDLDFVDIKKTTNLAKLANDLEFFFHKNTDLNVKATCQKFRIYLKFSLLKELGLAKAGESDLLFLKIEVFNKFGFCKNFQTDIVPLFKFNKSILLRSFDLPTMMATKIRAVLHRKWEKTDRTGKTLIKVKGRDYFDLMWYLSQNIKPNIKCVSGVKDANELKTDLLKIVENIDTQSIRLDLESLIKDANFIKNIGKNIKDILKREIEAKL